MNSGAESRVTSHESRVTLFGLAWRESRSTRRKLLLYMSSISLGVAALVAIDSFAGNITRSVREQSRALIGGDIVFSVRNGWTPASDSLLQEFASRGAVITKQTAFASMAFAPRTNATRLAQVRAVGTAYPLYGTITTRPAGQWARLHQGRHVLLDPALMIGLDARVGDTISLGYQTFEVIGALDQVPGDPGIAGAMAPRLFIPEQYMADTRLLITGSRGEYDAYARLSSGDPDAMVKSLDARLDSAQLRARTINQQEENITEDIRDMSNFLGLVGIIALLLGGVGVASGVNAWVMRKIDTVAILRCLGATTRQVMTIYITQAMVMGFLGAAIGATLGVMIQFLLPGVLNDVLPVDVSVRLEPRAIAMGMFLGLWIALAFALRPLIALRRVSPLQALRRSDDGSPARKWWRDPPRVIVNVLVALSVVGLSATRAEDLKEVAAFSSGIAGAILVLAGSAAFLSFVARRAIRAGWPYVVRQGVANLYRPGNQTRSVVLSLGFGAFLVTTLYLVQSNLLATFRIAEINSRGNLVFFDIQDDQVTGIDSIVAAQGREYVARVPIITMRVAAVNGRSVADIVGDTTRRQGQWALRREYRSTYRSEISGTEKVTSGTWFGDKPTAAGGVPQVSLESEVAGGMGAQLGDTITWNVQGLEVLTVVTSLREVNWQRFELNFFAVFEPVALEQAPKTFAALVMAPDDSAVATLQRDIVRRYPNVASLDLSIVRRTVAEISRRATTAIRFLAIFSLAMAVPVLFSAVSATRRDRVREGVLLKTLGATRRQITRILFSEYALLGLLGSLAGMILSFGGAWLLLKFVFERPFEPAFLEAGTIASLLLLLTVSIGLLAGRDVFRETPMAALRES
ncbi:MAG TPA: FtsX-like permease family protein [Gemmatimonadaceae bacterium]|nr:FtsX-like permease family protein [Gemmatimonadaceae bacterium]